MYIYTYYITGCTSVQLKKISAQGINVKLLQNKSVKFYF